MAALFEDHPFWDFSLAVYGAPGVSDACIALQERHRLDVNMLLFCAWHGASGRGALDDRAVAAALDAARAWNERVVCGLRAVRRWIKETPTGIDPALADALRRRIVAVEVDCEHAEQLALARAVARPAPSVLPSPPERANAIAASLAAYLGRHQARVGSDDVALLARIVGAALPGMDAGEVGASLAGLAG